MAMHHAIRNAVHRFQSTNLTSPDEDFVADISEFLKDSREPVHSTTQREILNHARALYADIIAGAEQTPRRPHTLICAVPTEDLLFSSSSRSVKIPYLGLVAYKGNQKAIPVVMNDGARIPMKFGKALLGYLSNEPCLVLEKEKPKMEQAVFGEQKLVRLKKITKA